MKTALLLSLFGLFGNSLSPATPVRRVAIARPAVQAAELQAPELRSTRVAVPSRVPAVDLMAPRIVIGPRIVPRPAVPAVPVDPSGSGRLACRVLENGVAAPATFRVLSGDRVVVESDCLEPAVSVPAGDYVAEIRLKNTAHPMVERHTFRVRDGDFRTLSGNFETARLTVTLLRDGSRLPGRATLKRDGQVVATLGSGIYATVEAGRYELEIAVEPGYENVYASRTVSLELAPGQVRAVNVPF